MAKFNPDVPQQQPPSYFSYSQPISQFEGDKSTGVALSGLGNVLSNALTGADNVIKSIINQKVYEGVDVNRESQTGTYEEALGIPMDQRAGLIQPDVAPAPISRAEANPNLEVIPGSAPIIPEGLQAAEKPLRALGALSATSKAQLSSYYNMHLDRLAQDLRSQYPGYRDYIDRRIESVTGVNPANEYLRNLQTVLAEGITRNRSNTDKALEDLNKEDVADMPGWRTVFSNVVSGNTEGLDPRAYVALKTNKWRSIQADYKHRAAKRESEKGDLETLRTTTDQDLTKLGYDMLGHSLVNIFGDKVTYNQFSAIVKGIQEGNVTVSDQEGQQLYQAAQIWRDSLYQQIFDKANTSVEGSSLTMQQVLGPDKTNANIKAVLEGADAIVKHLGDKNYGAAHAAGRAMQNITDDTAKDLMNSTDTTVRRYIRAQAAIVKLHGINASDQLMKDAVANNLPAHIKTVVEGLNMDIVLGKNTLSQAIDRLKKGGVGTDLSKPENVRKSERGAYEATTNIVNKISDPTIPDLMKKAIIEGSYGPGNDQLVDKFSRDSYDANGKLISGQQVLFNKMTSQKITEDIWNLSRDPANAQAWDNYKLWAEKTHAKLFGRDMHDVNVLASNEKLHFFYDTNTSTLGLTIDPKFWGSGATREEQRRLLDQYQQKISFINSGLANMKHIAEKEGRNPDAYLINLMAANGVRPDRVTNAGKILSAVTGAVTPPAEGEKGKGTQEEGIGSKIMKGIRGIGGYIKDSADKPFQMPSLDFISPANSAEVAKAIKGKANAARPGPLWGNPMAPGFKEKHLVPIKAGNHTVMVNKIAAKAFQDFLDELTSLGYKVQSLGGYALREKKGIGGISQHAFGNAIDINPRKNPWRSSKTDLPPNVSDIAAKHGLSWGGDWRHKDPMHFEYSAPLVMTSQRTE